MTRISMIIAAAMIVALAPSANARDKHADMMMPTMQQCHDGYQKMYKTSMHWSKHKFKHVCHKMMKHEAKMTKHMMKEKMMKGKT